MLRLVCRHELPHFAQEPAVLKGIVRGIEREALRVDRSGALAHTDHPVALGAKLTHPRITTDYAEALLEFITPPSTDPLAPFDTLETLHRFTAQQLSGEYLWAGSMPCRVGADEDIAIARYGHSNIARFKEVYRLGLGLRYGRVMQTIAGAHYNWSLPAAAWQRLHTCCGADEGEDQRAFVDRRSMGLLRNFLRFGWLAIYLFGASPALCRSFLQGRPSDLQDLGGGTLFGPHATSLRMSDLGYQNRAQDKLTISPNSLVDYTAGLEAAIRTPDPFYTELGVHAGDTWRQLNANLLQTESEYYAPIRPKQIGQGERPALALARYGVRYFEVRTFDLDPDLALGFAPEQAWFTDVLLLTCLFLESPPISAREQAENDENKARVVSRGRQPGLHLLQANRERRMTDLAHELFDAMSPFAELLDTAYADTRYRDTLARMRRRIDDPDLTPSARVLADVRAAGSYFDYAFERARRHTQALQAQALAPEVMQGLRDEVQASWVAQRALEAEAAAPFADFVAAYYA